MSRSLLLLIPFLAISNAFANARAWQTLPTRTIFASDCIHESCEQSIAVNQESLFVTRHFSHQGSLISLKFETESDTLLGTLEQVTNMRGEPISFSIYNADHNLIARGKYEGGTTVLLTNSKRESFGVFVFYPKGGGFRFISAPPSQFELSFLLVYHAVMIAQNQDDPYHFPEFFKFVEYL